MLYGSHLVNLLALINPKTELIIEVGNHWIDRYGQVRNTPTPQPPSALTAVSSPAFPYRVVAGFDKDEVWRRIIVEYPGLLGLLIFLGLISAATVNRLKKRSSSPTHEMQRALDAAEFIPYFQPVVRGDTKQWAGAEVLMRWQHPKEGLVRPDLFIPFAEHSGLIVPMTRSLMAQTAQWLAPMPANWNRVFTWHSILPPTIAKTLSWLRTASVFLPRSPGHINLVLELTERELIVPSSTTHHLFSQLHALGVMIAIDDFGTGHSSLSYLREFNVDYLKIDQSFVAMIGADALSRHILDSIIELSAKLDLGIVAEG